MPYIVESKREVLNKAIDDLVDALRQLESDDPENNMEGNLNYAISSIINQTYNVSYRSINDVVGLLECVKMEYYRKVAAPYETQKEFDNGPVY